MLLRIQKKLFHIKAAIDVLEHENDVLTVKGWIFSPQQELKQVGLIVRDGKTEHRIDGHYRLKRTDVYQEFRMDNAKKCGFYAQAFVEDIEAYQVWITYAKGEKQYKVYLGTLKSGSKRREGMPGRVTEIDKTDEAINIADLLDQQQSYQFQFPEKFQSEKVDIIVPVYNGYRFLDKLLKTIPLTGMTYRLILIDDKSPDSRVAEFLAAYAKEKEHVVFLQNEENLGFVQTVNRGLSLCENHVALVNTDVELPNLWLERLMLPILQDEKVASATPYSTCGTICSFPEFGQDNPLFLGRSVEEIDEEFIKIPPKYTEMPTGVGFCMGMSRHALQSVGGFDAESFGKGYGEENDWCQRAIEQGYKNVQVENLFVFHNHGGSFLSEDKKRYLKRNGEILLKKHPYYNKDVSRFCSLDPNREVREFIKLNLLLRHEACGRTILAFDHSLGGGATSYLEGKRRESAEAGNAFVTVRFDFLKEAYKIRYDCQGHKVELRVKTREDLFRIMKYLAVRKIWINELVTYPELYDFLEEIKKFSKQNDVGITMLMHDFFSVCPTINLLDDTGKYCRIPELERCENCLKNTESLQALEYGTMFRWRKEWKAFLKACEEVTVFSEDSRQIVEKAFGRLENIAVRPHQISYIPKVEKQHKISKTLNIGLLGVLTKHKGRTLIRELAEIIERNRLDIRIILIGSSSRKIKSPVYRETGPYTRDSIPRLILENDIDIFLIPSIWPETFSYTTEEIMQMGMPVMSFDIGAPAERIKKYEKGLIIPEISPQAVLKSVKEEPLIREVLEKPDRKQKVLFVVEEVTFSSRYRVDHLREQLIWRGIASDCIGIREISRQDLEGYTSVVVYRSSKYGEIGKLIDRAHRRGLKVYYDMDDYIFDYSAIKDLHFLEGSDYVGFETYSGDIFRTMTLCDGYIVSTNQLKQATEEAFPGKTVVINRNVASMEMVTISLSNRKGGRDGKIRLGYFSGSKTHNEDFESVKQVILSAMEKNENVHLMVGGQIELPEEFKKFGDRIETFAFVSWKKLPDLIGRVDINLMPLEDTFFHACKSENKWMEAALVKVPTIASYNLELGAAIEDGKTGYLCRNLEEWQEKLDLLTEDEKLRDTLAENAHARVLSRYTTKTLEEIVEQLLTKKN